MRIALVTRRFDPAGGGTERDLLVTADCLKRAGHEIAIYAAEVRASAPQWRVIQVGSPRLGRTMTLLRFAWAAPAMARRDGAELVLSFGRSVGADVLRSGGGAHAVYLQMARRWRGAGAVAAMRLRPYHRAQMAIERAGFTSALLRKAVAVSEMVRAQLIDTFNLSPGKVVTVYNGVDLDRFRPVPDPSSQLRFRQSFGLDTGAPVVAFAGSGYARKGLAPLLEAWPAIESRPYLLVAGGDRAEDRYRRMARRLGIDSRVRFLGVQGQIEWIFRAADAFALPSFFEPFGNVVMEAMASGLGVLASAQSGVSELMPDAMRRFIVQDPGNSAEIAERMEALLAAGKEVGPIARAAAEAHPWDKYGSELVELIESLG